MIDIENELFTDIATAVRAEYPGIFVAGEYVSKPPSFPAVSIVEMDNSVYTNGVDSGGMENFARVTYEVNVYSDKHNGRKAECRKIIDFIDNRFAAYGFARAFLNPMPNMNDATIYRVTARYRGVVSKDHYIYGR